RRGIDTRARPPQGGIDAQGVMQKSFRVLNVPIPINCPGCKKRYVLRDEMRGKPVRCKQCQRSFVVGETPSAPRPTPERERNGDAEPAVPRKKSKTGLFIVGGLVVCVLLFTCCGGVAGGAYYVFGRARQTTENFASQMAFADKD